MTTCYPDPCIYRLLAHVLRRRPYCKRARAWRHARRARIVLEDYDE